jgi:hypothetical protein
MRVVYANSLSPIIYREEQKSVDWSMSTNALIERSISVTSFWSTTCSLVLSVLIYDNTIVMMSVPSS